MASSIPGPARTLVRTLIEAIDAASSADAATFENATARLAIEPAGGRVLGDVLRSLLEDTHPDGLGSDDIALVVGRCYRTAVAWLPAERVDVTVLLAALAGALGVHEPGLTSEARELPGAEADGRHDLGPFVPAAAPAWADYAWHAPLLVADLLPFAPAALGGYLETTFAEYAREAREESP